MRTRLADAVDISQKPRLAVGQGEFPQVFAALEQQVEGEIDEAARLLVADRGL